MKIVYLLIVFNTILSLFNLLVALYFIMNTAEKNGKTFGEILEDIFYEKEDE